MNDLELKELLDSIETPPVDLSGRILDALRSRRKRSFPKKRILAAALAGSAALVGARQFYEYVLVGTDGSVEEALVASSSTVAADSSEQNGPLWEPERRSYRDFVLRLTPGGGMGYEGIMVDPDDGVFSSYRDLWTLLSRADVPLPAPAALPEGSLFEFALMQLYFPEKISGLPQKELLDGGNGYYFQVFELPESILQSIDRYEASFSCGDTVFDVTAGLSVDEEKLFAPGSAKPEKVKLGDRKAVYLNDAPNQGDRTVFFTGKIRGASYIRGFALGTAERDGPRLADWQSGGRDREAFAYRYFYCAVSSRTADREALLEFAQNMAVPAPGSEAPDVPTAKTPHPDAGSAGLLFSF